LSTLIILPKFLVYYFQCKYVVNYTSSISKSILIVPHNIFNIWFNSSQYYIQQNFVSCISQCCSPVILTPISISSFVYSNYYCFFPFFRYPFLLPDVLLVYKFYSVVYFLRILLIPDVFHPIKAPRYFLSFLLPLLHLL